MEKREQKDSRLNNGNLRVQNVENDVRTSNIIKTKFNKKIGWTNLIVSILFFSSTCPLRFFRIVHLSHHHFLYFLGAF